MVRQVDRPIRGMALNDGDLLHLVKTMLDGLTEGTKVKSHASEEMISERSKVIEVPKTYAWQNAEVVKTVSQERISEREKCRGSQKYSGTEV